MIEATAFWVESPGVGGFRTDRLRDPSEGEVVVRTLHTGVSRGTETTVFTGRVPESERVRMRAPFQEGDFGGPVKYGYLSVGRVEVGPASLRGRLVFGLLPHQSVSVVPLESVVPIPDSVPPRRAVLAGAVETAVTVLWDAEPLVGDRIGVVGAGMIGCAIARLASGLPGVEVTLVDTDPGKAAVAKELGVAFADPAAAPHHRDIVIDASGSEAGLQLALETVATEGEVVEASWFGDRPVTLRLGADFHSRRLTIRSSQVGRIPVRRRGTRTSRDRLELALGLLADPAFDALLTGRSRWQELPALLTRLAAGPSADLCTVVDWPGSDGEDL